MRAGGRIFEPQVVDHALPVGLGVRRVETGLAQAAGRAGVGGLHAGREQLDAAQLGQLITASTMAAQ